MGAFLEGTHKVDQTEKGGDYQNGPTKELNLRSFLKMMMIKGANQQKKLVVPNMYYVDSISRFSHF